jgi:hypothetical protein
LRPELGLRPAEHFLGRAVGECHPAMAIKDEDGVDSVSRDSLENLVARDAVWLMTILIVHSRPPANEVTEISHSFGRKSRGTLERRYRSQLTRLSANKSNVYVTSEQVRRR